MKLSWVVIRQMVLGIVLLSPSVMIGEAVEKPVKNADVAEKVKSAPKADTKKEESTAEKKSEKKSDKVEPKAHEENKEKAALASDHKAAKPEDKADTKENVKEAPKALPSQKELEKAEHESVGGIAAAGLDTENKASGNWVIKKRIWEDAQATFGKIRNINDSLLKKQLDYINKSSDIEKQVDTAFTTIGLDQGEIVELLDQLHTQIEDERKKDGQLTEKEREFEKTLQEKQEKLKQLKLDIKAVGDLDDTIQSSVKKVSEQIKVARSYENKAWDNFKKIGQILDHVEAQKLFYEIHSYYVSVQKIAEYINKGLWSSVMANVNKVQPEIEKIQSGIENLKQKGIDLKKELARLEQADRDAEIKRKKAEEKAQAKKEAAQKKKKTSKKKKAGSGIGGFFKGIVDAITNFINSIWNFIAGLFK